MKNRKQTVSNQVNILFVLTIIFIALCLFVPVWQSAVSSQLRKTLDFEERNLALMEDRKITLKAALEKQKSPEHVMQAAVAKNMSFSRISEQEASAVASSR